MTRTRDRTRTRSRSSRLAWAAFAAPLVVVAALAVAALAIPEQGADADASDTEAPDFTLPTTHGDSVSLDDAIADGPALLYFSMGPGCDGCFVQIPEIADELDERGVELVSIMPGERDWLIADKRRLGVSQPIAVDSDVAVSEAYDMLGHYGHSDVPSHSFALVTAEGEVAWERHYAEMFVPAEELLPELDAELDDLTG